MLKVSAGARNKGSAMQIVKHPMFGNSIKYVLFEKDGVRRVSSEEEWNDYFNKHGLVALSYFCNVIESFDKEEDIVLTDWYKMANSVANLKQNLK